MEAARRKVTNLGGERVLRIVACHLSAAPEGFWEAAGNLDFADDFVAEAKVGVSPAAGASIGGLSQHVQT
jgi:hypothetical protein